MKLTIEDFGVRTKQIFVHDGEYRSLGGYFRLEDNRWCLWAISGTRMTREYLHQVDAMLARLNDELFLGAKQATCTCSGPECAAIKACKQDLQLRTSQHAEDGIRICDIEGPEVRLRQVEHTLPCDLMTPWGKQCSSVGGS